MRKSLTAGFVLSLLAAAFPCRAGDKTVGYHPEQFNYKVPPSPALSPEEEMKTFKLQDGFRVELVAADPQVQDPIAITFGADGRLWVLEMRDYMPTIDGDGEEQPLGRITVLEDTTGTGKADKATVFLDHLVMPRSLALSRGGLLVGEPPNLWFCKEGKHDGVCTDKTAISTGYGVKGGQPEHMINGLMYALDNWIYNAGGVLRYKFQAGKWVEDANEARGQWGITQDDFGRLYTNDNSRILGADLVPPHYMSRNPAFASSAWIYFNASPDERVWPSRPTPGVNRGYQPNTLRPDGSLISVTACCGPCVYRGDLFPPEYRGNIFVCEPAGNLIKRLLIDETPGKVVSHSPYDQVDFMTSTDERFRPVNLFNGPDGALYIVDMYRGIIQHKAYMTTYLRENVIARKLDTPINLGRIWRLIPPGKEAPRGVKLPQETPALVQCLASPNGWWQDTAQRLLVERHDSSATPALEKLAVSGPSAPARLHALWTLQGMGELNPPIISAALADADPKVRAAAVRLSEPLLVPATRSGYLPGVVKLANDPAFEVQLQLALSLAPVGTAESDAAVNTILHNDVTIPLIRDAVMSGLRGREPAFLTTLLASPQWEAPAEGAAAMVTALARGVVAGKKAQPVEDLLTRIAKNPEGWRELAALQGLSEEAPRKKGAAAPKVKLIYMESEPKALAELEKLNDKKVKGLVAKTEERLTWPGKAGYLPPPKPRPMTAAQQALFDRGQKLYSVTCITCHQADGNGYEGLAPPLVDSDWVHDSDQRLIRIVLGGLTGPVTVNGAAINGDMPAWNSLPDEDLAALMTYVRRGWEDMGDPIDPKAVAAIRDATKDHKSNWTAKELKEIQ